MPKLVYKERRNKVLSWKGTSKEINRETFPRYFTANGPNKHYSDVRRMHILENYARRERENYIPLFIKEQLAVIKQQQEAILINDVVDEMIIYLLSDNKAELSRRTLIKKGLL